MRKTLKISLILLMLLSLISCKESSKHAYDVTGEFEPYVQRFYEYAEYYNAPIYSNNLVMRFANLPDHVAGRTYMNRIPVVIEIDRENWENMTGPNIENQREDLIFHEMGHGLLRRHHDNTVLADGDWKSIMCGDSLPDNRANNINYRGMRKEYYLKELFTQTTETPDWSTYKPDFSGLEESELLKATAETTNCWLTGEKESYKAGFEDGKYFFHSISTFSQYVPLLSLDKNPAIYDVTKDFYFEANIKAESGLHADPSCGICFLKRVKDDLIPLHYITCSIKKYVDIGENSCATPFIQLYSNLLHPDGFNKIAIRKQGEYLYYFINGEFVYYNDLKGLPVEGKNFGFLVSSNTTITVDYATIKIPSGTKAAPVYPNSGDVSPVPFEIKRQLPF